MLAEQVKVVPATKPLKGKMETLETVGERFERVFEPESLSLLPLVSVTVAVQVIESPTLAVEALKVNIWLVPKVLVPLVHT